MSTEVKELRVGPNETTRRIMYLAKEFLLNSDVIDLSAGTASAGIATRAAEALVRLNYVTYQNVRTETSVMNDRRRTRLLIELKKTSQFNKLYQENLETRKRKESEREEQAAPTTVTKK